MATQSADSLDGALSPDAVREHLRGVAVGLLTPFDSEGEIRHDDLAENARTLYDEGIRTSLATANISEYHSLGRDERVAHAETAVEALPADACVLAGVGGSTSGAIDLILAYEERGVDAMMIMPPDHTYLHERGLLEYYRELAAVTDRPLVPYVRVRPVGLVPGRPHARRRCRRYQVRPRGPGEIGSRCGCGARRRRLGRRARRAIRHLLLGRGRRRRWTTPADGIVEHSKAGDLF